MSDESAGANPAHTYARRVGQRLRAIRRQKGLSLQDVEAASGHEFKASVLGAYERGERIISVPRLQRLAGYYEVPVDQLLPPASELARAGSGAREADGSDGSGAPANHSNTATEKVTFDLARFRDVDDPELEMVRQYLNSIQVMRQDFNGRMLTIRRDDIRAIAGMFGTDPGALVQRLEALELRMAT
ncbi:MAG TPA: transcriptional regulator [Acidimicrobiales bacterium]|nr:transcriptional regulator [Acidimicrobiales bacterium]